TLADAIHHQAEQGGRDHGEQRQHAGEEPAELARGTVRVHEELDGEGLEGKDARVKHNAQGDDVPVGDAELEEVLEYNLVGRARLPHGEVLLGIDVHDPINHGPDDAQRTHSHADEKRV